MLFTKLEFYFQKMKINSKKQKNHQGADGFFAV